MSDDRVSVGTCPQSGSALEMAIMDDHLVLIVSETMADGDQEETHAILDMCNVIELHARLTQLLVANGVQPPMIVTGEEQIARVEAAMAKGQGRLN